MINLFNLTMTLSVSIKVVCAYPWSSGIIMTAREQELPNGATELPTGIDIIQGLEVVEMTWCTEY